MGADREKQAEKPKPETDRKDTEMKLGVRERNSEENLANIWKLGLKSYP